MAASNGRLLGRIAVQAKLITMDQLSEATRQQGRTGARLGDIFVGNGWVTPIQLEKILAIQRKLLAEHAAARAVEREAPNPPPQAQAAWPGETQVFSSPPVEASPETEPSTAASPASQSEAGAAGALDAALLAGVEAGASDVHFHAGAEPLWRVDGALQPASEPLSQDQRERLFEAILDDAQRCALHERGQIDLAYTEPGGRRFRVNLYRQQRGLDGVFRALPGRAPSLEQLGLPTTLARLVNFHQGLVLVTGTAGCGKSSTLAALVDILNEERSDHILCIEDPIEIVHASKRSLVNQRQVERHTESFGRALRAALREDPDVIAIGELRDLETISLALTAAETGHLVLATLHTNNAIRTIDRLIGVFPPSQQSQVRTMLSESLRAVVTQCLVPARSADGAAAGRVPAIEVLYVNRAVGNLIRENKTFQIRSILQTGASQGMGLLDDALAAAVDEGRVAAADAARFAEDPGRFAGGAA